MNHFDMFFQSFFGDKWFTTPKNNNHILKTEQKRKTRENNTIQFLKIIKKWRENIGRFELGILTCHIHDL